jgi:pimeloyl-ACP methyl ester carboxylesterase
VTEILPPSRLGLLREPLGALEIGRLLFSVRRLAAMPRGGGETVIVMPGYGAGDASTLVLRMYLSTLGYDARGWGLGRNDGNVPALVARTVEAVSAASDRLGVPVRLVGWSLGGYIAREIARELPDRVACVVTLGSPVVGGPKYTTVGAVYRRRGYDLDAIERDVAARYAVPIRVPVTAIYSRADGVVAWRACIDEMSPRVEHVEVSTTHVGLGFSPEVYAVIAGALARAGSNGGETEEERS